MIYKVYLIDGDSSISLLELTFKELKKIQDDILTGFFNAINKTIDLVHEAMSKGRRVNEMNRVLGSEDSTIFIYYHPLSRVLFCTISDADDNTEKIKEVIHKISNRFSSRNALTALVISRGSLTIKTKSFFLYPSQYYLI